VTATVDTKSASNDSSSDDDQGPDQYGVVDEANSDVGPTSSEAEEPDPASDEKVSARKPSKKALENAMNEVSVVDEW
jgi:hypothetical protein